MIDGLPAVFASKMLVTFCFAALEFDLCLRSEQSPARVVPEVPGSNPARDEVQLINVRCLIAQSLSLSPVYCLNMIKYS